jgi:hypothetical protein
MRTRRPLGLAGLALALAGCAGVGRDPLAFKNPFETERPFDAASAPTASTKAASRVHAVGSAVVGANAADLSEKPVFMTIGLKEPMVFHRGAGQIVISEALVDRCPTDAELAAVVCWELAKVAVAHPPERRVDTDSVPTGPLARDVVGGTYEPDMTRLAEEARFDRRPARGSRPGREPRPDAKTLAQNFYAKTGRNPDDLARLELLLRDAEDNAERRDLMTGR